MELGNKSNYISEVKEIVSSAKRQVYNAVNSTMVKAYWLIGKRIIEEEQNGEERAGYGKSIIKMLSNELTEEFGSGFSTTNVKYFRQFYQTFPLLKNTLSIGHVTSDQLDDAIRHVTSDQFEATKEVELNVLIFTKLNWTHIR